MSLTYKEMIESLADAMEKCAKRFDGLSRCLTINDSGFHIKNKYGFIRWCQAYGVNGYLATRKMTRKRYQLKRLGKERFWRKRS